MPSVLAARWSRLWSAIRVFGISAALCGIIVAGACGVWWLSPNGPAQAQQLLATVRASLGLAPPSSSDFQPASSAADPHAGHHHGDEAADSLTLSEQGRKNIGLQLAPVQLRPFTKTITIPGMIVGRPGRSLVAVTAPLTGVVTRIHRLEGEAVEPGQPLFDLRLTHEDLVQKQAEFLHTHEDLEIAEREIKRIAKLAADGALPGKQLLEREYEKHKLEAALRSQRQALLLHGVSASQIDAIVESGELLQNLTVVTPSISSSGRMQAPPPEASSTEQEEDQDEALPVFQIQTLKVAPGQHISAGDTLALLADHAQLYIQGEAFERDIPVISRAAAGHLTLSAQLGAEAGTPAVVEGLLVSYLAPQVDPDSRTMDFFVALPNEKVRDVKRDERRLLEWRFRPGQRVQLLAPVETLPERIVLPLSAVALEGAESYVFTPNGAKLERRPVHLEYRDQQFAVIANDGSLFPGELVAVSGAQQLQLALKNKAGGGIDPHAGHTH